MKATFEKTVDILVKAYLNGTLEHGKCSACAVGNLVAAAKGTSPIPLVYGGFHFDTFANGDNANWHHVFMTVADGQEVHSSRYRGPIKEQIDSTGYPWQDLARIEYAFETAPGQCSDGLNDEWMFNGLMAVVDVLADIHGIDLQTKESAKLLFQKA